MNFRQRGPQDYAEGVSKHLNRTIRHNIDFKLGKWNDFALIIFLYVKE